MSAPYPDPQISAVTDLVTNGTNVLLTDTYTLTNSINTTSAATSELIVNIDQELIQLGNQSHGIIARLNILVNEAEPIIDGLISISDNVKRSVTFLFVVLIVLIVTSMIIFISWFIRKVLPILRGIQPVPLTFLDLMQELTVSRVT